MHNFVPAINHLDMKTIRFFISAILVAVVMSGCSTKIERTGRNGNQQPSQPSQPSEPETEVVLKENKTWTIEYAERKYNEDGSVTEEIQVNNVPSGQSYESYKGDVAAFLKNEAQYNSEYVYTGSPQIIQFGRFRHGTWYAFIIALNSKKEVTGEYAYSKFTVEEEEPTEEYLAWLGNWKVSQGGYTYNITVSREEANLVYRVDGWEVIADDKNWNQMNYDDDHLETFYEPTDGNMYFVSQYLTEYQDEDMNNEWVQEYFLGQIDYDGIHEEMGLYIIPDEGLDLAYAVNAGGNTKLNPCKVKVKVGDDQFEGNFYCMQYFYTEGKKWYKYNDNVPALPMKMERSSQPAQPSKFRSGATKSLGSEEKPLRGQLYRQHGSSQIVEVTR